ncbi:MAG: hypothetical protein GF347_03170 [Candidatus Moranbacteria bacterium]|nr:hypothetical protein [Candidatus Moranbacteria bacterium]
MIIDFLEFYFVFFLRFAHYWWFILPLFALYPLMDNFWMYHVGTYYATKEKHVVMRIKVPREQVKSPLLMENVINGFWRIPSDPRHFMDTYVFRIKEDYYSLEIASIEGQIHFAVWVREAKTEYFKMHIYSQYPDAEVEILEKDYLSLVPDDIPNEEWDLFGLRWILQKADAYPIKTYRHFEDSVTGNMIDPLGSILETMSTLGPGELLIYQVLVHPVEDSAWKKSFQAEVEKILDRGKEEKKKPSMVQELMEHYDNFPMDTISAAFKYPEFESKKSNDEGDPFENLMFKLSPGEQEWIKEMEQSHNKRHHRCQYATVYAAKKSVFDGSKVDSMIGAVDQFSSSRLNGFDVYAPYITSSKYFMEEKRKDFIKRLLWRITKDRKFSGDIYHLNTEELATIWHFPDMAVKAPKTPWVESKKSSAPSNLPISDS